MKIDCDGVTGCDTQGEMLPIDPQEPQTLPVQAPASNQLQTVVTTQQVVEGVPSREGVINFIAYKYFQTVDPSKPEELNGFVEYLERVRKVLYVRHDLGSIIITVGCNSLQILEELWDDFCTGHLNEMAQAFLVTEDILEALGVIEVKLSTSIAEDEYIACRKYLLKGLGEYICVAKRPNAGDHRSPKRNIRVCMA